MPAWWQVFDEECSGGRYDGSCWSLSVFHPCILSVLIAVLWHILLMKIHVFYSSFWVCGTSRLPKQMNKIWHGPVIVGVPLPAPWAGCVFKSLESSARLCSQMSFLPGRFKWPRWLCRPNPNLKIIGVLMKCRWPSMFRIITHRCLLAVSLLYPPRWWWGVSSACYKWIGSKGIRISCKWWNFADGRWAF